MEIEENKWRPSISSLLWIALILFGVSLYFLDVIQIERYSVYLSTRPSFTEPPMQEMLQKGFSINTPGCRIPEMKPFDENIKKYIETRKPVKCNNGKPALFASNSTSIFLLNESLPFYNVNSTAEFECCYREFWRVPPKERQYDNNIAYSKTCKVFNESTRIPEEFITVECRNSSDLVMYKDYFAFIPLKNFSFGNNTNQEMGSKPRLNVLMIGLDGVSRANFHRQMPKTVDYLLSIDGVELQGYNKVADNTFPNMIPVLTGMFEAELRNSCWPDSSEHFDQCYFVWKDYKKNGYVTAFGEDSAWMGLFNYQKKGFLNQPADYVYDSFNMETEKRIGNSHKLNVYECEGAREVYQDFLRYIEKFILKMDEEHLPYFAFFWGSSLSHDDFNKPSLGDNFYYNFFKKLKEEGHLRNTALIFLSDHGIRWGEVRQTYQGRMEERLPFVIPILPDWFKKQYTMAYANLKKNVKRLTTPFDLHEMLYDFLNLNGLNNYEIAKRKSSFNITRGYSLFSEIPNTRSCADADIDNHWCTCQQSQEISITDPQVVESAQYAVEHMNNQLIGYAQCAELTLGTIMNAQLMTHGDQIRMNDKHTQDYLITLRTMPSEGVFEVTVRRTEHKTKNEIARHYEVIGTISRLNLYGTQSSCITDFHLKLYCYCTSLLL